MNRHSTQAAAVPVSWDVFVSYARSDARHATALAAALERHGLRVFVDDTAVEDFASISTTITSSLSRSKALLALYSYDYPQRRACQWELTYAYLAGQREGDPRRRVLVVNPEPGDDHIHPLELRDARYGPWQGTDGATEQLAARVAAAVSPLTSALGEGRTDPDAGGTAGVPWLPAPARVGSARFVGRLPEQWLIHSALQRHHMPLISQVGQGASRAAQLRGMPGIGKSLLAQEYALRFRSAFPGGIFWFDLHTAHGATTTDVMRRFTEQLATVVDALGLDRPGDAGLPQMLSRLAVHFGEAGAPYLWVVDGLPDGLTDEQLHLLRAPHLLASTLITTRSQRYPSFAETIDLAPLPDADGYRLLTTLRTPGSELEEAAGAALVRDVGGHPHALDLLAYQAASSDFERLRNRLHSPGTDVLASRGPSGNRPSVATALLPRPLTGRSPQSDVLRLLALACPAPLSQAALEAALASVSPYEPWEVGDLVSQALDSLLGGGSLRPDAYAHRAWTIHPLLARAVRRHDTDTARQEDLRRTLLHSMASSKSGRAVDEPPVPAVSHLAPTPGPVERAAAFDLQVELVTRIGVQPLADEAGSLREALSSMHTLFTATRDALHRVAAESTIPVVLPGIAARMLNVHLRPFLTRWHTALQRYEVSRPGKMSAIEHEQRWEDSERMRAELQALQAPLTRAAEELAAMCGISLLKTTQHQD